MMGEAQLDAWSNHDSVIYLKQDLDFVLHLQDYRFVNAEIRPLNLKNR